MRGRILLVEDHPDVHRLLCDVLRHAGYQADCTRTKREALERLRPGSHRLVIADVRLPDGSGRDVADRASELGIRSILMSGHPDEIEALRISRVFHLAKPFSVAEFQRAVDDHMSKP